MIIMILAGASILASIFFVMNKNKPTISIKPEKPLLDQELEISVCNLKANEKIILELSSNDKDNNIWKSKALFQADNEGIVNVTKQAPLSGSYSGIDPMGLFWSMKPTSSDPSKNTLLSLFTLNILNINLSVFSDDKLLTQKTIHRLPVAPNVEKKEIRKDGIVGTLFYQKNIKKNPGVILIPGSGGIIPEHIAQLVASHGYTVLALAYFGYEKLPKKLSLIPLEYFHNAIDWLKNQPQVKSNNIAIIGHSRGAEIALLLASTFPQAMNAVIAISSPHLIYSDFLPESKSAWTYKNKPLQFMPYPSDQEILDASKKELITLCKGTIEDPFQDSEIFLYGINKYNNMIKKTTIPVEHIKCPLLIISGEDDKMWPSSFAGDKIIERLNAHNSKIEKKYLSLQNAGHNLLIPPYIPSLDLPVPIGSGWSLMGGTQEGNARAQKEAWHEIIQFLEKQLKEKEQLQAHDKSGKLITLELIKIDHDNHEFNQEINNLAEIYATAFVTMARKFVTDMPEVVSTISHYKPLGHILKIWKLENIPRMIWRQIERKMKKGLIKNFKNDEIHLPQNISGGLIIAKDNKTMQPLGFVHYTYPQNKDDGIITINNIACKLNAQHNGLGEAMVKAIVKLLPAKKIRLGILKTNDQALNAFSKYGFTQYTPAKKAESTDEFEPYTINLEYDTNKTTPQK